MNITYRNFFYNTNLSFHAQIHGCGVCVQMKSKDISINKLYDGCTIKVV